MNLNQVIANLRLSLIAHVIGRAKLVRGKG